MTPLLVKQGIAQTELGVTTNQLITMRPALVHIATPGSLRLYFFEYLQELKAFASPKPLTPEIAREYARTNTAVNTGKSAQTFLIQQLQEAVKHGCLTAGDIAQVLGISESTVRDWHVDHGIPRVDAKNYPAKTKKPALYDFSVVVTNITWFGPGTL